MFFESWSEIGRIIVSVLLVYPALIFFTHIMGKRSFAKMNNFDWIVTIAIGSILGSAVLLKKVVILEVLVAVGTLLLLQFLLTLLSSRFSTIEEIVKVKPSLLFYKGEFMEQNLKAERVSRSEIEAEIRKAGYSDILSVSAVIFETEGEFSVIGDGQLGDELVNDIRGAEV